MKKKKTVAFFIILIFQVVVISVLATNGETGIINEETDSGQTAETMVSRSTDADTIVESELADDVADIIDTMIQVAHNDSYVLYYDEKSSAIGLENRKDGSVWFSNPMNLDDYEDIQLSEKMRLSSQIDLVMHDDRGQRKLYDNFTNCISKGFFTSENITNGIQITYHFGMREEVQIEFPQQISDERFRMLFLDSDDLTEDEKEELKGRFRYSETYEAWFWRTTSVESILERLDELMKKAGYTYEDYLIDSEQDEEREEFVSPDPEFDIVLRYILEDKGLVARVFLEETQLPEGWYISEISLLRNFGATHNSSDGYLFVPSGSGSKIIVSEESRTANQLFLQLYGPNAAMDIDVKTTYGTDAVMPVYGIKNTNGAMFAIIEKGDAIATVNARRNTNMNPFYMVFPAFQTTNRSYISLGDGAFESQVITFQKEPYNGEIQIRYMLLEEKEADIPGMAARYREYLMEEKGMERIIPKENIPFHMETVGSIVRSKSFLGFSYVGNYPMTTYEQNFEMAELLMDGGVDNINIRLKGWFNGGREQDFATRINPVRVLGGTRGFNQLVEDSKDSGIELFPDVLFLTSNRGRGFSIYRHSARTLDQRFARYYRYNLETDAAIRFINPLLRGYRYLVSPSYLPNLVSRFSRRYDKYENEAVSLGDLGKVLFADFSERNPVSRQEAFDVIGEQAAAMAQEKRIMTTTGNANVIPHSSIVLEVPVSNREYLIEDEGVAFFQMVFHGLIEYAGEPLNKASSYRREMLRSIELGSGVYYRWTYQHSSKAKYTSSDDLYSTYYADWLESALDFYHEANEALKDLQDKFIIDNRAVKENVRKTEYEDGTVILVNYGRTAVEIGGITIEAEDFVVIEGGIDYE